MSLSPLFPGRLPNSLRATRFVQHLQLDQLELARLQQQLATGQKFLRPGEAPGAALKAISLQNLLERKQAIKDSIVTDRGLLVATEAALASVSDALNQAKALAQAGIGATASPDEKQAMAAEVAALLQTVRNAGNTVYQGRYLFGGSQATRPPFAETKNGQIIYLGDTHQIDSFVDLGLLVANNADGQTAFNAMTSPVGNDLDAALLLETKIADLHGGVGIALDAVEITLQNGPTTITKTVDLSAAETVGDLKTVLENAFAAESITLTVDIDPGSNSGLRLTPSTGTITVADTAGSQTATDLGIASTAVAVVNGGDLDPRLSIFTPLSALNGGTGIGSTAGTGLQIVNDKQTFTVDLSSVTTVGELMTLLQKSEYGLHVGFNADGSGLAVSSRISGARFAIGENGGANATLLGLRTLTAQTLLADMNRGAGVPVDDSPLQIVRRDGSTVDIDLSGAVTVQDVLDRINAVDPGQLVASLNSVGNGITLTDNSGSGPLTVVESELSKALGIAGTEATGPGTPLVGEDVHQRESQGVIQILMGLHQALLAGDDAELSRLSQLINQESDRLNLVRGELGARQKLIDDVENRVLDQEIELKDSIATQIEINPAEVVTLLMQKQQTLEASLQTASRLFQLNLLQYL